MLKGKLVFIIGALLASQVVVANPLPEGVKPAHSTNPVAVSQTAQELRQTLALIPQFSSVFEQQVFDAKGGLIQKASGNVEVSQPNQFRWQTNEPDESLIVSDGESVWVYNPFVEQVSILSLDQTVKQSPLWLIANQTDAAWSQFKVTKDGNTYSIKPNDPQALTRQIEMSFSSGKLTTLRLVDSQGQSSVFELTQFNSAPNLAPNNFTFIPPTDVDIDDQRSVQ